MKEMRFKKIDSQNVGKIRIEIFEEDNGDKYYERIEEVNNYWGDQMPMLAMEEAGEFIQAVSKLERSNIKEYKENLIKEMADMMISIKALTFRYGIEDDEVLEAIDRKLEKKY